MYTEQHVNHNTSSLKKLAIFSKDFLFNDAIQTYNFRMQFQFQTYSGWAYLGQLTDRGGGNVPYP